MVIFQLATLVYQRVISHNFTIHVSSHVHIVHVTIYGLRRLCNVTSRFRHFSALVFPRIFPINISGFLREVVGCFWINVNGIISLYHHY